MSGEKTGDRAAMERVIRRIRGDGVSYKQARKMARESMERVDRKLRDEGKR